LDTKNRSELNDLWRQALAGNLKARAEWQVDEGGIWTWQNDGVHVHGGGSHWSSLNWMRCSGALLRDLKNFVIEVSINGQAEAAGFSFGAYKDFLTPLEPTMGTQHLQLEVDASAVWWAFRVEGQLIQRAWWDGAINSTEDILNGMLTLKGCGVQDVHFQELAIHTFEASCQVSIILICYRFLQRLRVSLHNWCNQEIAPSAYEVLVVNPASPDGTHEYLAAVARCYPHVCIREVAVENTLATNKGKMINRAVAVSRGEWIWLTDADVLFSPTCVAMVMAYLKGQGQYLFMASVATCR
jgi:Glycosyl transferase family 2